jgi:hypothetical protein
MFHPIRELLERKYRRSKVLHIAPTLKLNSKTQNLIIKHDIVMKINKQNVEAKCTKNLVV